MGDNLASDGLADGENEAGAAKTDQPGGAGTNAAGAPVPFGIAPGREVVDGQNRGGTAEVGDFKVGAVKKLGAGFSQGDADTVQPPLSGQTAVAARHRRFQQIRGRGGGQRETLVGEQHIRIFGEFPRQRQREFGDVAGKSPGGKDQRRRVDGDPHLLMLQLPVVVDVRIVVGDTALVGGVVETIGRVDQHAGRGADDLVAVRDTRRNEDLPRA